MTPLSLVERLALAAWAALMIYLHWSGLIYA